ncbi:MULTISPECIES: SusD/RagB family nutrient-binding outer membrane lipoprotein [Chitinophagaceae]
MGKNIVALVCIVVMALCMLGCTHNFSEINTDPNGTSNSYPEQLLAPALVNALSANMNRNRGFNNELMQVTVSQSDADAVVFRYNFPVSWSDYLYNNLYGELTNFRDIYLLASDSTLYNASYMGISLICQSWLYSILTDTYGDIPFSDALLGRDSLNFTPKFDKQKDIYSGLFLNLEKANSLLSQKTSISASNDPVYGGDVTKWRKFGNSLYLRLLLRVSGKTEVADSCIKKIQQITGDAVSYPIMTSNSDAAILRWTGNGPYVSPWYSVRAQSFRAVAVCSFFIDHLSNWNDPRIDIPTYGTNKVNRWGIAPDSTGQFRGVVSGYLPGHGEPMASYFYATDQTIGGSTPPANCLQLEPLTGMMMNYAELQFILCECAAKGWITNSAETYYDNGVQSSITQWLPNWTVPVTSYLNDADMSWDDSEDLDTKMEKIHLQKYYALFCTDMQQWFEYRRTGHPALPKGAGLQNGGVMPARMPYPAYLLGSNPTHYAEAIADQGPDVMSTQVWWQKP